MSDAALDHARDDFARAMRHANPRGWRRASVQVESIAAYMKAIATLDAIARERDEARASALEEAAGWLRDHRPNYMDYKSREGDESATWWGFNWEQPTSDAVDAALDRCAQAIDALATRG